MLEMVGNISGCIIHMGEVSGLMFMSTQALFHYIKYGEKKTKKKNSDFNSLSLSLSIPAAKFIWFITTT